jgi:hypothetical protein
MGACLWDDREPAAERIEAQFRQVQTVDREPAGFELDHPEDGVGQSRLARPSGFVPGFQSDALARLK